MIWIIKNDSSLPIVYCMSWFLYLDVYLLLFRNIHRSILNHLGYAIPHRSLSLSLYIYMYICVCVCVWVLTNSFEWLTCATQGQFLNRIQQVWIQDFLFRRPVATQMLNWVVWPTIYPKLEREQLDSYLFQWYKRYRNTNCLVQDLNSSIRLHFLWW